MKKTLRLMMMISIVCITISAFSMHGYCASRDDDIRLLAALSIAEAENQDDTGKRLVIDVVLNRLVDMEFPNTIENVVYEKSQFSCVTDGRLAKAYSMVTQKELGLVMEELTDQVNYDVVYFRAGRYADYGTPVFQHGDHYFSR